MLWVGMPEFVQVKQKPYNRSEIIFPDNSKMFIRFENKHDFMGFLKVSPNYHNGKFLFQDRGQLASASRQKITEKTKSIWFPFKSHWGGIKYKYTSTSKMTPRYPVYIVSKGRWGNGVTTKALNTMGVKHYIVVEQSEKDKYEECCDAEILVLPQSYLDDYSTCDNHGETRSKGPGGARNFCMDHSSLNGFAKHWVMDDNLDAFHYLNRNEKYEVECGATICACEDFVDRFGNVPVAGMNYYSFCKKTDAVPPFTVNTRIYSCLLIENGSGYRWRGRYNEDTDLSLRVLKDGLCTIQFNAFLCGKITTQRMKGGNSREFYDDEGTLPKSEMIKDLHPDVAKVVWRFNRWHHHVDYSGFKDNRLRKVDHTEHEKEIDYGLRCIQMFYEFPI